MHGNSMDLMKKFIIDYGIGDCTVIDIGSFDVNGTYKPLFENCKYIGADIVSGKNVDILMDSKEWEDLEEVDVIICGQTLEHVTDIPKLMDSIYNKLKPGGMICMIAPSAGPAHHYPVWVGNFDKERMTSLVKNAGFEILSCEISPVHPFYDNCCIARKEDEEQSSYSDSDM